MLSHDSVEIRLIPAVKQFRDEFYPDTVVILHPSIVFGDDIFNACTFSPEEARRVLKTHRKTGSICEVTPDYGLFRRADIVGIRLRVGHRLGRDLFVEPDSAAFLPLVEFADPIPYMGYTSRTPQAPAGRRMVVLLTDGSRPLAIVDHKGGKTYNSSAERNKIVGQARIFGAAASFMLTEKPTPTAVERDGAIPVTLAREYSEGTFWRLSDSR